MVLHASAGLWHLNLLPLHDGYRMLGIYMKNSIDWIVMERAGYAYNASIVALYDSLGPDSTEYILNQTKMVTIACTIVELKKLTQVRGNELVLELVCSLVWLCRSWPSVHFSRTWFSVAMRLTSKS